MANMKKKMSAGEQHWKTRSEANKWEGNRKFLKTIVLGLTRHQVEDKRFYSGHFHSLGLVELVQVEPQVENIRKLVLKNSTKEHKLYILDLSI